VVFRSSLFGSSGRLRVYPASGKVEFVGKPLANASIFLHPVGVKAANFPRPRAVVGADGTFVLGTYRKDDGAPPGDYKVTVQWFHKANPRDMPRNVLPPRYAGAETSGLTLRINKASGRKTSPLAPQGERGRG
jgi:hypothetical protein